MKFWDLQFYFICKSHLSKLNIMIKNLSEHHSLVSNWVSELRNTEIQNDRMRFRRNLERIGEAIAYEISKTLPSEEKEITTPLGIAVGKMLKEQPVLATILRAGLPLHQGLLNYFDKADNAFISAYRKHNKDGSFEIKDLPAGASDFTIWHEAKGYLKDLKVGGDKADRKGQVNRVSFS